MLLAGSNIVAMSCSGEVVQVHLQHRLEYSTATPPPTLTLFIEHSFILQFTECGDTACLVATMVAFPPKLQSIRIPR
jgi:hypothetical protein